MIADQFSDNLTLERCLKASCSASHEMIDRCHNEKSQGVTYIEKGNILCLNGNIEWGGDYWSEGDKIKSIKKFHLRKNVNLVVSSLGGELTNAIMISRYLRKYNYSVIVSDWCLSACAQFLFIGSNKRTISEGGVVAFHGGPFSPDQIQKLDVSEAEKDKITKAMNEFYEFYKEMKVPIEITYDFPQSALEDAKKNKGAMWSPNKNDYKRYRINVVICPDIPK